MSNTNTTTKLTANEIGTALNFNPTTIRTWARKPIVGKAYNPDEVNIDYVREQLRKSFTDDELLEKLGCPVDEIELVKASKVGGNSSARIKIEQMVEGRKYYLVSHVYKHEVQFIGTTQLGTVTPLLFIFKNLKEFKSTQDQFRVLSFDELNTDRWTIREIQDAE